MKKVSIIFLSLLIIVLITGCNTEDKVETLVCTTTENEEEGIDTEQVISMTFKNDKLSNMKIEFSTTISDENVKSNWTKFKEQMDKSNKEYEKDGISFKVETDDENFKYNTILDIDVNKASEEDLTAEGFDGLKTDAGTLKSNKEAAEKDGAVCTVK